MESIYIKSPTPIIARHLRPLVERHFKTSDCSDDGLVIHGDGKRVYIYNYMNAEEGADDLACNILLNYSSEAFVKKVITLIANDSRLIVDNDHGVVLSGDQFVSRIQKEPDWHWHGRMPE